MDRKRVTLQSNVAFRSENSGLFCSTIFGLASEKQVQACLYPLPISFLLLDSCSNLGSASESNLLSKFVAFGKTREFSKQQIDFCANLNDKYSLCDVTQTVVRSCA